MLMRGLISLMYLDLMTCMVSGCYSVSGHQGIRESYLNLGRPLARGTTFLGTQDK